jgi:hypothetical protein
MVHSLDTTADGLVNFRETAALLFSGRRRGGEAGAAPAQR